MDITFNEGLDYFVGKYNALTQDLLGSYKKLTGHEFDIDDNGYIREISAGSDFDLHPEDKPRAIALALLILDCAKSSSDFLRLFQSYEFANALKFMVDGQAEVERVLSGMKRSAAYVRWKADPKTEQKLFVKECWKEWQQKPTKYKSKASFALDMLDKCENLTSSKVIENWCREWEKE